MSINILLVDDDMTFLELITLFSKKYDVNWIMAPGQTEALKLMAEQKFDVIVLDYNIMDGTSENILRESHKLQPICKIIIFSGFLSTVMIDLLSSIRYVAFVRKPNFINDSFMNFFMRLLNIPLKNYEKQKIDS